MLFLRKHWGNIIFIALLILLLIPQTRLPIQVFLQRLFSGSPKEISAEKRKTITDYSWQLLSLNNKPVDFSVSAGKVTVVNFWATWCPPCLAEMPSLQDLYNEYGNKVDFYFVGDEQLSTLQRFLTNKGYNLPVFIEQSPAPAILQSSALPSTFVISKEGKIAMHSTGAEKWNSSKVHQLLDKLLAE